MTLRLLAVDLPPLVKDLLANALLRRDGEGVFVDLPHSGGDIQALALAARADAVVAALCDRAWPPYCAELAGSGSAMPLFGLDCDRGRCCIREPRALEPRCTERVADGLTIDELVDAAQRAACGGAI